MGSISRHITPLVINSLRGGHTHANTHTDIRAQDQFQETRRVPGLKTDSYLYAIHHDAVAFHSLSMNQQLNE